MNPVLIWVLYGLILLGLSRFSRGSDALLPGRISVGVQALAYVSTYVSAVALVGFAGLCHGFGLQMMLITAGNVWLGTWFVYRFLAWPTRLLQRKTGARTPAQLLARGAENRGLRIFWALLFGGLLLFYTSAVLKGAAFMLTGATSLSFEAALVIMTFAVAIYVAQGGLRGVLFTEAFQGALMLGGVVVLVGAALAHLGGFAEALKGLAALPATPSANRGFLALASGEKGFFVITLVMVTSVGVWAQPQLIQRHFALSSRKDAFRAMPLAMLALTVAVGGAYFSGALSRLILGPGIASPDRVIPEMVRFLLPEMGRQLFTLAIVSASLSTAAALIHIGAASLGEDLRREPMGGRGWVFAVVAAALGSGFLAYRSGQLVALMCTMSWTLVASAALVPYLALLSGRGGPGATWISALSGLSVAVVWYLCVYSPSVLVALPLGRAGGLSGLHPFFPGLLASSLGFLLGSVFERVPLRGRGETAGF